MLQPEIKNVTDGETQTDEKHFIESNNFQQNSIFLLQQILEALNVQNALLINNKSQVYPLQILSVIDDPNVAQSTEEISFTCKDLNEVSKPSKKNNLS